MPYAITWGGLSALPLSLRADLFGRRHYATIQGFMSPIMNILGVSAPIFAAWVFERTGSYEIPLLTFGTMGIVAAAMILMIRTPSRRRAAQPGLIG